MDNRREKVVSIIKDLESRKGASLKILDVGGGHYPFAYATHVVDLVSYEQFLEIKKDQKYSEDGIWGDSQPRFTSDTWICHNICSDKPLPFPDKYFDYCVATHILEDLMNPFRAIEEINRVSKAGYIEVPSKEIECTFGMDGIMSRKYAGYNHHFWMFSLDQGKLIMEPKYSFIPSRRCFHFPKRFLNVWKKKGQDIIMYFWKDKIEICFPEISLLKDLRIAQKEYIRRNSGYSISAFIFDAYNYLKNLRNKRKKKLQ